MQSCTKGIWIWVTAHPRRSDRYLVLLDTEGLGDVEKVREREYISITVTTTIAYTTTSTAINNNSNNINSNNSYNNNCRNNSSKKHNHNYIITTIT